MMKLTEAVEAFKAGERLKAEHADVLKQHDDAKKTLREYFERTGKRRYRGVVCRVTPSKRFDTRAAKDLLTESQVAELTVESQRYEIYAPEVQEQD